MNPTADSRVARGRIEAMARAVSRDPPPATRTAFRAWRFCRAAALLAGAMLASGGASAATPDASVAIRPAAASAVPDDTGLRPFRADFVLEWKGIDAASATLELTHQAGNHYTYVSRNTARALFRAVLPGELKQTSRLLVEDGQVKKEKVAEAIKKYGLDPNKPNPVKV